MPDNAEFASFVRQRSCDQPTECCELLAQRLMLYPVPIRCAAALRTLLPLHYPYRCLQAALDYFTASRFSNAFAFQKYPATGAARSAASSSNNAAELPTKTNRPPPERATVIDERIELPLSSNAAPCVRATSFTGTSRKRQREDQRMDEEEPARARTYTKVLLGVDKRERLHGKHSEMEKAATAEGAFEECVSVTLPIGDFVFLTRDPDGEGGGALRVFPIVVERKTVSDLLSSVVSSRLAMQKTILQRSPFHVLCLLIEGNIEGGHVGPSSSSLHHHHSDAHALRCSSSMTSTMVRDGIAVVRTKDSHGTVEWLRRCATELEQKQQHRSGTPSPLPLLNDVVQHVVSIRAEFEVRSIAVRMLSAVHGISANFAEQILRCVHAHHTCIPPTGASDETASMVHLADVLSQLGQPASSSTGGREIVPAAQRFYAQLAQLPKSQVQRRGLAILAELFGATAYH